MAIRQTRIFVPWTVQYRDFYWYPTLLGSVVRPLIETHPEIEWFWFSRHECNNKIQDTGDCDLESLRDIFFFSGDRRWHRSLRFRYSIPDHFVERFEREASRQITDERCMISDWRPFDWIGELADDRHIGEMRDNLRREQRAALITQYYHSASRLILHHVVGPNGIGWYRFEENDVNLFPFSLPFERILHLICNVTTVHLSYPVSLKTSKGWKKGWREV